MNALALVIIQDKQAAEDLAKRLIELGLSVLTATSKEKALELADSAKPDVVFVDMVLALEKSDHAFYPAIIEGKGTSQAAIIITEGATEKGPSFNIDKRDLPATVHDVVSQYATADRLRVALAAAITESPRKLNQL